MPFNSKCMFRCAEGFKVEGIEGLEFERTLVCQISGSWNADVPKCKDYEPPRFTCPGPHVRGIVTTAKGKATGKVPWKIEVKDNSLIVDPKETITVNTSHQPSQEFPIGMTSVRVIATDGAGNIALCFFLVEINDTEPPTFSHCPGDIVREEEEVQVTVNWKEPSFFNNSSHVNHASVWQNGGLFAVPSVYEIEYTAWDPSGNRNSNCIFRITLKRKLCTLSTPPRNGALVCISKGAICVIMCRKGTDLVFDASMLHVCANAPAKWHYWSMLPYKSVTPGPNCAAGVNPSSIWGANLTYYYYDGDAHDLRVQDNIKENFHKLLTLRFHTFFNPCSKDDMFVVPGIIG